MYTITYIVNNLHANCILKVLLCISYISLWIKGEGKPNCMPYMHVVDVRKLYMYIMMYMHNLHQPHVSMATTTKSITLLMAFNF